MQKFDCYKNLTKGLQKNIFYCYSLSMLLFVECWEKKLCPLFNNFFKWHATYLKWISWTKKRFLVQDISFRSVACHLKKLLNSRTNFDWIVISKNKFLQKQLVNLKIVYKGQKLLLDMIFWGNPTLWQYNIIHKRQFDV